MLGSAKLRLTRLLERRAQAEEGGMGGQAQQAARNPIVARLGRAGLAAKGVVYSTVAVLALQVAFGRRGQTSGQQGALSALAGQPFGRLVLSLVALGLGAYALWRLAQFVLDPGGGSDAKAKAKRISYLLRALFYGALCVFAVRLLLGSDSSGGGTQQAAAGLLGLPGGRVLVGLVGIAIAGVGLYQGRKGVTREFVEDLQTARMSGAERRWVTRLGVVGYLARAVVFTLIGVFFVQAALQRNPRQAGGLDAALAELAAAPAGPWLLALVAAGLLAYGVFTFALARFGRIYRLD